MVLKPQCCQRIDRTAAYRLEQGWQADEYYDAKGNKVQEDAVGLCVLSLKNCLLYTHD